MTARLFISKELKRLSNQKCCTRRTFNLPFYQNFLVLEESAQDNVLAILNLRCIRQGYLGYQANYVPATVGASWKLRTSSRTNPEDNRNDSVITDNTQMFPHQKILSKQSIINFQAFRRDLRSTAFQKYSCQKVKVRSNRFLGNCMQVKINIQLYALFQFKYNCFRQVIEYWCKLFIC